MTRPKTLVTSAAGHTGRPATLQLLQQGYPVRAFVRSRDGRALELERAGAEIFVGNLHDFRDLRKALSGVQRAYHCPPFTPNVLYDTMLFAVAAEEAKLEVVALLGAWNPHATHPSIHQRGHWIANQVYRWMPSVDVIHVDPGVFALDYFFGLPAIVHFGLLMAPLGDGLNAPPSSEDIAAVASTTLVNPEPHVGRSYRPTGPRLLSPPDIAGIMGQVLDRKVTYRDVAFRTYSKAAIAQGYLLSEIAHLRYYVEELRNGAYAIGAPTEHVREVTGSAPEAFETIARRYTQHPELIHKSMKIGSKLDAYRFLLKMILTRPVDFAAWERDRGYPLIDNAVLAQDSAEWRATAHRGEFNLLPLDPPALNA
ncbi:MAG: NmrA family NAD(P)-binding protein [Gammaproteobacteria bacterium]